MPGGGASSRASMAADPVTRLALVAGNSGGKSREAGRISGVHACYGGSGCIRFWAEAGKLDVGPRGT